MSLCDFMKPELSVSLVHLWWSADAFLSAAIDVLCGQCLISRQITEKYEEFLDFHPSEIFSFSRLEVSSVLKNLSPVSLPTQAKEEGDQNLTRTSDIASGRALVRRGLGSACRQHVLVISKTVSAKHAGLGGFPMCQGARDAGCQSGLVLIPACIPLVPRGEAVLRLSGL